MYDGFVLAGLSRKNGPSTENFPFPTNIIYARGSERKISTRDLRIEDNNQSY